MAMKFLDRARFLASAGGDTGLLAVSSAVTGFLAPITAGVGDGDTVRYSAEIDDLSQWEVGYGTFDTGLNHMNRDTVVKSSNSNARVNFSSAPKVRVGGPLAQDMAIDLIAFYNITNDGPYGNIDLPLDATTYTSYVLVTQNIEVDLPTGGLNDELVYGFDVRDGSGTIGGSANLYSGLYSTAWDGDSFSGTNANHAVTKVLVGTYGVALVTDMIQVTIDDNVIGANNGIVVGQAADFSYASPPKTATILRMKGIWYDDSLGGYGAQPDLIGGTVAFYGKRR